MKKFFLFVAAIGSTAFGFAQHNTADSVVKFQEKSYNFGKIKQSVTVKHDFVFTNISDVPVIIESATASCGCTTPVKPEGAIAKGKTDKIVAGFSAPAVGAFNKTITVKFSGVAVPVQLMITGEVLNADDYAKYQAGKDKTTQPTKSGSQ
jgi:hypothetical protein